MVGGKRYQMMKFYMKALIRMGREKVMDNFQLTREDGMSIMKEDLKMEW